MHSREREGASTQTVGEEHQVPHCVQATTVAWPTQKCHVATRASSLVMAVSKQRSVRENV